jgi:hypothetical protein
VPAVVHLEATATGACEMRDEFCLPQREQHAGEGKPATVGLALAFRPVEHAAGERRRIVRIGNRRAQRGVGEAREAAELGAAAVGHGLCQLAGVVAEVEEGRAAANSSPMKSIGGAGASSTQAASARSAAGVGEPAQCARRRRGCRPGRASAGS